MSKGKCSVCGGIKELSSTSWCSDDRQIELICTDCHRPKPVESTLYPGKCRWHDEGSQFYDMWKTDCGETYESEASIDFKFCPYCGGKLETVIC